MRNKKILAMIITTATIGSAAALTVPNKIETNNVTILASRQVNTSKKNQTKNLLLTVSSMETGSTVNNQEVSINGITYKTNSQGEVLIKNLKLGNNTLNVTSKGYQENSISINIVNNLSNKAAISIAPYTGTQNIKFINMETGQAMANSTVDIAGTTLETNSNGVASIGGLWSGESTWTASSKGFNNATVNFNVKANETTTTTVDMAPEAGNTVITFMNIETGSPMANSNVNIGGRVMKTNSKGQVSIDNLWPGQSTWNVSAKGFNNNTVTFNIEANKTTNETVNMAPEAGNTVITFMNIETGSPMANSNVNIGGRVMKTNSKGQVSIDNLWPGQSTWNVSAKGFNNNNVTFNIEANKTTNETVNMAPIAGNTVITFMNMETGSPMANTDVNIGGNIMKTNSKGQVSIDNLWPGQSTWNVSAKGFYNNNVTFNIEANKTTNETVNMAPVAGNTVITFVNMKTGSPMANTEIKIAGRVMETNAKGEVSINNLWPGQSTWSVSAKGFHNNNVTFNIEANKTTNETVNMNTI